MTRKPRAKGRIKDNWDWLIYKLVERAFEGNPNVTFQIGESTDVTIPIYDHKFRLTHGDQFSGGGGVGGLGGPLSNANAKKLRMAAATDNLYDYLVMGHFHNLMFYQNIIVNGSTKGYDEYAYHHSFNFELPMALAFGDSRTLLTAILLSCILRISNGRVGGTERLTCLSLAKISSVPLGRPLMPCTSRNSPTAPAKPTGTSEPGSSKFCSIWWSTVSLGL
jgi:hypothetical protein